MIELKAPRTFETYETRNNFSIFLGGSIDQGSARNWQQHIAHALRDKDVILFNPRRDDWDSKWEQSLDNQEFVDQVTWEQYFLENADYRIFVMTAESKSPITLLELGQFIKKPGIVLCEKGFYRKANVDITAKLNGMPVVDTMEDLIRHLEVVIAKKQWGQK